MSLRSHSAIFENELLIGTDAADSMDLPGFDLTNLDPIQRRSASSFLTTSPSEYFAAEPLHIGIPMPTFPGAQWSLTDLPIRVPRPPYVQFFMQIAVSDASSAVMTLEVHGPGFLGPIGTFDFHGAIAMDTWFEFGGVIPGSQPVMDPSAFLTDNVWIEIQSYGGAYIGFVGLYFIVTELIVMPQRAYPRNDGLGMSTKRSWPPPTSRQFGHRSGPVATYL